MSKAWTHSNAHSTQWRELRSVEELGPIHYSLSPTHVSLPGQQDHISSMQAVSQEELRKYTKMCCCQYLLGSTRLGLTVPSASCRLESFTDFKLECVRTIKKIDFPFLMWGITAENVLCTRTYDMRNINGNCEAVFQRAGCSLRRVMIQVSCSDMLRRFQPTCALVDSAERSPSLDSSIHSSFWERTTSRKN